MRDDLQNYVGQLKTLAQQTRHVFEQAEAKVGQFNEVFRQLGDRGLVPREVFLGLAISRPYDPEAGIPDAGQVIQAALIIPEGFGVCRFDTQGYRRLAEEPAGVETEARGRFVPFARCEPVEKAFLNTEINALFERFVEFSSRCSGMR